MGVLMPPDTFVGSRSPRFIRLGSGQGPSNPSAKT